MRRRPPSAARGARRSASPAPPMGARLPSWRPSRSPSRRPERRRLALILDTGPLLAALDAADPDHRRCAALITEAAEDRVVPTLVLAELDYWCHKRLSANA